MNTRLLYAASILTLLGVAGCQKAADPAADMATTAAATDPAAPVVSPPAEDPGQSFVNVAAASDAFEIEASNLAMTKATSPKIKKFADEMVKAHTDSTKQLMAAAAEASPRITPAARLTAAQQAQLDDLRSKSGEEFDRAYAEAQVMAHQSTLDALKGYSAGGDVPSLKQFADKMVPIVTAHLNMAKAL